MKKLNLSGLCFLALAAVLNLVGANLALALRLPIYLDSMGTMLGAALLGPVYGMLPGAVSAVLSGCTTDVYAFYYLPVQLATGLLTGLAFHLFRPGGAKDMRRILPASLLISLPGTVISSAITALVFGGITSSGSTVLVQIGEPINVSAYLREHASLSQPEVMNLMKDELTERMKEVILYIPDDEYYDAT